MGGKGKVLRLVCLLDVPWRRCDEYYIQKLALTLDAASLADWIDLRKPD